MKEKGIMNWSNLFLPLIVGVGLCVLGIAFIYFLYGGKEDATLYKLGRNVLLLVLVLWCVFVLLSVSFHISFYFVVIFVPLIGVIVFLASVFISRQKR